MWQPLMASFQARRGHHSWPLLSQRPHRRSRPPPRPAAPPTHRRARERERNRGCASTLHSLLLACDLVNRGVPGNTCTPVGVKDGRVLTGWRPYSTMVRTGMLTQTSENPHLEPRFPDRGWDFKTGGAQHAGTCWRPLPPARAPPRSGASPRALARGRSSCAREPLSAG